MLEGQWKIKQNSFLTLALVENELNILKKFKFISEWLIPSSYLSNAVLLLFKLCLTNWIFQ